MRIAYVYDVIHPYVKGGAQKRIWELARRLAQRGHNVTIFGMKHWEGEDITYSDGVRLWGVCPPRDLFSNGHRSVAEAIYFARKVLPPLLKEKYDVVDAANFPYFPCFSAKLYSVIRRSRLVVTWHEVWGDYWFEYLGRKGIFGKVVEKLIARMPHDAVAVSNRTREALERLGYKHSKIIPDGADVKLIESVSPSSEESDIIFAGRLIKEKNVPLLIEAMDLLRGRGTNARCIIIGDGPDMERLQGMVQGLNLNENVRFRGHVENDIELISLMKSSKVFVFPSLREGFGIIAVEANACGLPVVTVNHPRNAAADLIVDGRNGLTCEVSGQDMAEKILAALSGADAWKTTCKQFAKEYDWDVVLDMTEQFYQAR